MTTLDDQLEPIRSQLKQTITLNKLLKSFKTDSKNKPGLTNYLADPFMQYEVATIFEKERSVHLDQDYIMSLRLDQETDRGLALFLLKPGDYPHFNQFNPGLVQSAIFYKDDDIKTEHYSKELRPFLKEKEEYINQDRP